MRWGSRVGKGHCRVNMSPEEMGSCMGGLLSGLLSKDSAWGSQAPEPYLLNCLTPDPEAGCSES